jgi:hypothetical protein
MSVRCFTILRVAAAAATGIALFIHVAAPRSDRPSARDPHIRTAPGPADPPRGSASGSEVVSGERAGVAERSAWKGVARSWSLAVESGPDWLGTLVTFVLSALFGRAWEPPLPLPA